LTAFMAQVKVYLPGNPVPVTLQVFAVLFTGLSMSPHPAFVALTGYLAFLASGVPIGAGGTGGITLLGGATGGYLLAFPFAAALFAYMKQTFQAPPPFLTDTLAVTAGILFIYLLGAAWLGVVLGSAEQAWLLGVVPFIVVDTAKAILAVVAANTLITIRNIR
jgi:biotin transport system substrate-specific component